MYKKLLLTKTFFLTSLFLILYFIISLMAEHRFEGDALAQTDFYFYFQYITQRPLQFFGIPLITSFFYHKGLNHLFLNVISFFAIGSYLERKLSRKAYISLIVILHFLLCAILFFYDFFFPVETLRAYSGASGVIVSMLLITLIYKKWYTGIFFVTGYFIHSYMDRGYDPHLFSCFIGIVIGFILVKKKVFLQDH